MRRIFALACTAALALGTARADTTLVVSMAADPTGLDPEAVLNNTSGFVMATVYDSLVRYKPGTVEVEPGLAQSWDITPDGLTYTFHLRKGVKFQDGTPVNADAVIQNIDRQLNKNSPIYIYNTGPVENYRDFTYGSMASYRAVDDSTVEIKMKAPSAAMLASLAMVWNGVVSPTAAAKYGKDFRNHPVGSGPFIFKEWRQRDQVALDANPDYWKGKPQVDHLVFKEYPDAQAALLALKRGEVQVMGDVASSVIPSIRSDANLVLLTQPGLVVNGMAMSTDVAPFTDKRVRQALNYAVDKDAEKLAVDMIALQEQIDNPNAHTCTTCGQGLAGTDHLTKVTNRLQKQVDDLTAQIQKAMSEADACNAEAESIDVEIEQLKERYASKKEEARSKAKAIQQDIEIAKTVLAQHREAARERITERQEVVTALQQEKDNAESSLVELREALTNLGHKPVSKYHSRDAVWKFKQERDLLLAQIETEMGKPNIHLSKIEGLQSTLIEIDYEPVNELNLRLKHEVFLYKLLTAKDSFIRKKIIDQNLSYLNNRLNHYLEKLRLPHEVRFMPDLTVEIALLGRELDFEQLSSGEKNRLILANSWAFRDVWESSNESFNLYFLDEIIDGLDGQGAESALMVLQGIARDRNKSVFLISHKDNLIGRADRVMMVRKEDQFTTIIQDYHMAA